MSKISKSLSRCFIPQVNNIKITQRNSIKEILVPKITQKCIKFISTRKYGKDESNSNKENIHSIYNNHCTKIITIAERKKDNNIYIKKHSSASQVAEKSEKLKKTINENTLKENKSVYMINRKKDYVSDYYYNKNYYLRNEYSHPGGSKLSNSISFGVNNCIKPSTNNNNSISVRLSNPKNNRIKTTLNNRNINLYKNNNNKILSIDNNYYKSEMTQSSLDLM